jgi:hypothetical protein
MSAAIRLADTLLCGVGGRTVLLHMPAPAVPNDLGEQIGLATPEFQDIPLAPVVFRKIRATTGTAEKPKEATCELLVSASAVNRIGGSLAFDSADVLFAQAGGVMVDGTLYGITWAARAEAFGSVFLYRLGLRGAVQSFV